MPRPKTKPDESPKYTPRAVYLEHMKRFIDSNEWFTKRNGDAVALCEEIALGCGYTSVPANTSRFYVMVAEHLRLFYCARLAARFELMVHEQKGDAP